MCTSQTTTQLTADELFRLPSGRYRYELIDGDLRVMEPAGGQHGYMALKIMARLVAHVEKVGLGKTFAAETGFLFRTNPDTVRAPDGAFIRQERLSLIEDLSRYIPIPPDLAVEVVSPNDTESEVENKVFDWLDFGTHMVVVVDPKRRALTVYRSRDDLHVLTEDDVLDGADVVPGWRLRVGELFE